MNKYLFILLLIFLYSIPNIAQDKAQAAHIAESKQEIRGCLSQGDPKQCQAAYEQLLSFLETSSLHSLYFEEFIRKNHLIDKLAPNEIEVLVLKKLASFPEGALKNTIMSNGYLKLTILYYYAQQFDETERTALIALQKLKNQETPDYEKMEMAAHTLSNLYAWSLGQLDKALQFGKQSLYYAEKAYGQEHQKMVQATGNIAVIYSMTGAQNEALDYYKRALALAQQLGDNPENNVIRIRLYQNIAMLEQDTAVLENFLEALKIAEKTADNGEVASILTKIGYIYIGENRFQEAQETFEKALKGIYKQKDNGIRINIKSEIFQGLAQLEMNKGNKQVAKKHYQEALNLYQSIYPDGRFSNISTIYSNMADFWKEEDLEQAIQYYRRSIIADSPSLQLADLDDHVSSNIIKHQYFNNYHGIYVLLSYAKAIRQRYQQTNKQEDLSYSLELIQAALELSERSMEKLTNPSDKLELLKALHTAYAQGINLCFDLYQSKKDYSYIETAFLFAESNKSVLLQQTLQRGQAMKIGQVPDSLIQQEHQLKLELSALEEQRIFAISNKDSNQITLLTEQIFHQKETLKRFAKELERSYPKYYQLRYDHQLKTIKQLQDEALLEKQALLEYFIAETDIFLFYIPKDAEAQLLKIPIAADFPNHVKDFRKGLSDFEYLKANPSAAMALFAKEAHWFYQQLLQPVLESASHPSLIIIPDGLLSHLPFETFLMTAFDPKSEAIPDYLLKDYSVSYAFSGSLLHRNQKQKGQRASKKGIFGFAPDYPEQLVKNTNTLTEKQKIRRNLLSLPAARQEVEALAKKFQGTFLYDSAANEVAFKENAKDYAIIHLAMHGILNKSLPMASMLVFSENRTGEEDDFLHIYELTQMELNAELIVLSACETGYGKFEQGEGVLSLGRAFMYAGSQSLLMSLWQVNDQSTSILMDLFYSNLAKGLSKDEALRQAKLSYIKKVGRLAAHPAFWAAFIQLGDARPIIILQKTDYSWLWYLGGGGLLVLIGLLLWGRKRPSQA